MGEAATADLRCHERLELVDRRLPGTLWRASDGQAVFASSLNVSEGGLGITTGELLAVGADMILTPDGGDAIHLRVVWQKEKRRRGAKIYRYGLAVLDADADLVGVFFAAGRLEYMLGEPSFESTGGSPV